LRAAVVVVAVVVVFDQVKAAAEVSH